jgi:hypothetical protein
MKQVISAGQVGLTKDMINFEGSLIFRSVMLCLTLGMRTLRESKVGGQCGPQTFLNGHGILRKCICLYSFFSLFFPVL